MVTQLDKANSTSIKETSTNVFSILSNKDIEKLDALYNNKDLPANFRSLAYTCKLYSRVCSLMTEQFAVTNGGKIALAFQKRMIEQAENELTKESS